MSFREKLNAIAKSYDVTIIQNRRGFDQYADLPEHLTSDSYYPSFLKARKEGFESHSGRSEIKAFLSPDASMKFVDLGCCLNLICNGYDEWNSLYHGVDISNEIITLLRTIAIQENIVVGSLYNGSIHETPYPDNYFDIGACIGVLEYFEKSFVEMVLVEINRIMKPYGRFVLDIPNNSTPMRRFFSMLEAHLGRPIDFDLTPIEFEILLRKHFKILRKDLLDGDAMIQYFLMVEKS